MNKKSLIIILALLTTIGCQNTSPNKSVNRVDPGVTDSSLPSVEISASDAKLRQQAQQALNRGNFESAQQYLLALTERLPEDYLSLATSCHGLKDYQCAADGYIQASIALGVGHPNLPTDINDKIWRSLSRSDSGPALFSHRYHHAWWLLQQQIREANSIAVQAEIWASWQQSYPSHPARLRPPRALSALADYQPPAIAVFLPTTGPLGNAGAAIRDGLMTAYLTSPQAPGNVIKFYDTHQNDIATLWEQALAGGAEVTIGPLLKQNAQKFAQLSEYADIPRLTLNYLDQPSASPSLYQVGISIEDEINALTAHVAATAAERVMVVHSSQRWSARGFAEFEQSWPHKIHSAQFTDIKELTAAVGTAMQVEASEQRKSEIQNIIGSKLEFLPRGRGDLDAVIALTDQVESLALIPALRFHFASNLPVYATSQSARGERLGDLKGFSLTDMPIFLAPTPDQITLRSAFSLAQSTQQAELYALGFDAYRLATWLPVIDRDSGVTIDGATGYLWLDENGKFKRDLDLGDISKQDSMTNQ